MACTELSQKIWLSSVGTVSLLVALSSWLLWKPFALNGLLYPQLILQNGTMNFENWIETPETIELNFEIFMFNWTNADQVHNHSVKPHFAEMGPYVFRERHIRTNVTWNSNGTVSFNQIRVWHFNKEKSNGTLDDEVTNLNVIAAVSCYNCDYDYSSQFIYFSFIFHYQTVAYASRNFNTPLKFAIGILMRNNAPLTVTRKVRELLFDGYEDDLLTLVRNNSNPAFPKPPFEKFGWFVDRNNSWEYDGNFTMSTGENDIFDLGNLQTWKFDDKVEMFRGQCDKVQGTTGELWPPIREGQKPDLSVFATDICRSVTVKYDSKISKFDINGYKWVADEKVFDNGVKYPDMACYCLSDEVSCPDLLPGVFNASACKFDAPAFVSFPHFYLADKNYISKIDGMSPDKDKHEFYVSMEPRTGIPLDIRAQLQINLLLQNYPWTPINDVPETMIPMFWFRQTATLSDELASQARLAVMLPDFGNYLAYALVGISLILFGVFTCCCMTKWRKGEEQQILVDNDISQ